MMIEASGNKRRKKTGNAIMLAGFIMILANALDYLLAWEANLFPLMIIGLSLVAIGANLSVRR